MITGQSSSLEFLLYCWKLDSFGLLFGSDRPCCYHQTFITRHQIVNSTNVKPTISDCGIGIHYITTCGEAEE